jgi:putative lipoprotein
MLPHNMDSHFSRLRHGVQRFVKSLSAPHRTTVRILAFCCVSVLVVACISYRFTGTNINYDLIKTIQIDRFPNRAPYGWAPMEAMFNNKLQDIYANQTRLTIVKRAGDMHLSGEIVGYDQFNKGIAADGFSSQVQLRLTVNVRFENKKNNQRWERQFSASAPYDSRLQLAQVQERIVTELIRDITDQIFNATVADW